MRTGKSGVRKPGWFKVLFGVSHLRIVILQVVEVCLGFEEQLHDCGGIGHELQTEQMRRCSTIRRAIHL